MKNHVRLCTALLTALVCIQAYAGDPGDGEVYRPHFFGRLKPRGGWNPDGRGIFHWWNPDCYPNFCGPDDYCRKPMPNVCRPRFASSNSAYNQPHPAPATTPHLAPAPLPPSQ